MSVNELLSQDEIDALLHGVDDGEVETENDLELQD
ncbi:MAG: flagellar motor switch protein FliM, partial [Gammaproteobacteria bacterium]|nr:flagellar motor switch protein FliM [Gammaproteobacteria bacterium]